MASSSSSSTTTSSTTTSTSTNAAPIDPRLPAGFKKATLGSSWLSDPSTYPVIAVVALAAGIATFTMSKKMLTDPAVKISQQKKHSPIRV